jgi:predicted alpha-1,2-mannosidase
VEGGGSREERVSFYTALYHAMLMPSDRTGENPKWTSQEPYYDDFYAVWDTFRTTSPLLTLIAPERQALIVRSMIDIARREGFLPEGRSGNDAGRTQGGSNGQIVVAEAVLKGLPGVDAAAAYASMVRDSEVPPLDPQKEGRGGLADYNTKGYVSLAFERSASRTLEYAHDDWAVAQVAKRLFRLNEYVRYMNRAKSWENLWDETVEAEGVKGFIRPRNPDGAWLTPFDVKAAGSWPDPFYEGDSWEYSTYVPHDVRRLIERCGGREAFVKRLDALFDNGHFRISNEPAFHIPMLYIWAGRHDKTVERVRQVLEESFHARADGLPGNDDSGATSAWFAFQAMGIYPNPGHDYYLITSPLFSRTTIQLAEGKTFVIEARKFGGEHRNPYVRKATLNGRNLDAAWLPHAAIQGGGRLVLEMSPTPEKWPSSKAPPPPSLSDE